MLVEAVIRYDKVELERLRLELSPLQQKCFDLYLGRNLSLAELADETGNPDIKNTLYRMAQVLMRNLPAELVQRYLSNGPLHRVTLEDVAAAAGVSKAQAWKGLHGGR